MFAHILRKHLSEWSTMNKLIGLLILSMIMVTMAAEYFYFFEFKLFYNSLPTDTFKLKEKLSIK